VGIEEDQSLKLGGKPSNRASRQCGCAPRLPSKSAQQSRQLGEVRRQPPRLVLVSRKMD